jgi:hypothetical protein
MSSRTAARIALALSLLLGAGPSLADQPKLIAIGSMSGLYEDFAARTAGLLENGVPGNRLGGLGSGLTWAGGQLFLGVPDRGPNAVSFNPCTDDTVSYINRFHTLHLSLSVADPGSPLPFTVTPMLVGTTLLSSRTPLVYGAGCGTVGGGAPALNTVDRHYFTGRSDGFDPGALSTDPRNARFDSESIRVSNDGRTVYISDEYGPYVYAFDRFTGERSAVFTLPVKFAISHLSAMGSTEISGNTAGRVTNKGMEGLALTPDGRTLVGAMQSPLIQDGGDVKGGVTRIVAIDIRTHATKEFAYQLDKGTKTTVSDIVAINDHQLLVDERDSKGRADAVGSKAGFKKLFIVDIEGATDISALSGASQIAPFALAKTLLLDVVSSLTTDGGLDPTQIPAKLEGITFGPDVSTTDPVTQTTVTKHTLFIGNDNDFLGTMLPPVGNGDNPNQWFVFSFTDADLPGFVPQQFHRDDDRDDRGGHGR